MVDERSVVASVNDKTPIGEQPTTHEMVAQGIHVQIGGPADAG